MTKMFKTPAMPEVKAAAPLPSETDAKKAMTRKVATESKSGGSGSTLLSTGGRETLGA